MMPGIKAHHFPHWETDLKQRVELQWTICWEPPSHERQIAEAMVHIGEPKAHVRVVYSVYQPTQEFDIAVGERVWIRDESNMPHSMRWTEVLRRA